MLHNWLILKRKGYDYLVDFNLELQLLFVHMTYARKSFNEVTHYVNKV